MMGDTSSQIHTSSLRCCNERNKPSFSERVIILFSINSILVASGTVRARAKEKHSEISSEIWPASNVSIETMSVLVDGFKVLVDMFRFIDEQGIIGRIKHKSA